MSDSVFTSAIDAPADIAVPYPEQVLTIIRREHKALGAVLHEMKKQIGTALASHAAFDCSNLKTMLGYIKNFPDKLHHPKEDAYLFARISQRSNEVDATIAELKRHHAGGDSVMARLETLLSQFESGFPPAFDAFCTEFNAFYEVQFQHIALEENVILPAAEKCLTSEDWAEIGQAFDKNGDPRFGPEPDKEFQNMYSRIMRAAPMEAEA
jgi:hemerythrin-like domain-containing protein